MISAKIGSLEQRPKGFNRVGVNLAPNIFTSRMLDAIMGIMLRKVIVHMKVVGVNRRSLLDVLLNRTLNRIAHDRTKRFSANVTASLNNAENRDLPLRPATSALTFALAANVRLVHLDSAREFVECTSADSVTNAVQHKPSSLLRYAQMLRHSDGRDSLLMRHDEIDRGEPCPQWQRGVLEDRPDLRGELLSAVSAFQQLPVIDAVDFPRRSALYTDGFPVPTRFHKMISARFLVGEVLKKVKEISELCHFATFCFVPHP